LNGRRSQPHNSRSPNQEFTIVQFALGLLVVFLTANPSDNAAAKVSIERMKKDLTYLSSTELEGRGINTPGIVKAAEHIRAEFKRLGLKSGTEDGSYFQPFEFGTQYRLDPAKTSLQLGGKKLTPGKDFIAFAAGGASPFKGPVVFAGYGITLEGDKYDDYKGVDVAGKVVVVMRRNPRWGKKDDPLFTESVQSRHSPLDSKINNAIQHKAAAILFVNDAHTVKNSADDKLEDVNLLGRGRGRSIPIGHITQAAANALLASSNLKSIVNAVELIEKDLKAHTQALYDAGEANGQFEFALDKLKLNNVVGVIEGAGPTANETVVIGAHYDHVGYGQFSAFGRSLAAAKDRNRVHHGADDNGSGTAVLMELARRFAERKTPPARRLVFIAFSAEETGLIGSKHYASEKPLFPIRDTAAMLNLDMVGRLREGKLEIAGNKSAKEFEPLLAEINKTTKLNLELGPQSIRSDSDHWSFSNVGVPVLFFFTKTHPQYHKPTDTVDLINFEGMHTIVQLAEGVIDGLATMPKPTFIPPPKGGFAFLGGSRNDKSRSGLRATLGIMPNYTPGVEGVKIDGVTDGGAAMKAGLVKDDVIVEIGPDKIANIEGYMATMGKFKGGDRVKVKVKRGQDAKTFDVQLSSGGGGPPRAESKQPR
jgi:hypothetical protein